MKRKWISIFVSILLAMSTLGVTSNVAYAANTDAVLGNGVCINEILIDPNGANNFDTDGNGIADALDEFVEIYNLSVSDIDISGWQLWDDGQNNWFTFPGSADSGTTVLKSGAYAVLVAKVQTGGSLPTMTNPDSLAFDANVGTAAINNGSDNVVLYDPGEDKYIQLRYNGDGADNPPVTYAGAGFSSTATRIGTIEDWGSDTDGKSLSRYPSGDTNVAVHDTIPGAGNASPTALTLTTLAATSPRNNWLPAALLVSAVTVLSGAFVLRRRRG